MYLAFRNLFRNTRRTLAIVLTLAFGAGALFSFEGFIHGVLTQYKESTVHSHYGHGQVNTKGYRETVFPKPWEHWISNAQEIEKFLLEQEGVEYIFPRIGFSALLKKGNTSINGFGQGIDAAEESKFFHSLHIEEGAPLINQDTGILLGKGLATALDAKPGDRITLIVNATDGTLSSKELILTGIFHTGSFDFDSRIFRIQLPQAKQMLKTSSIELISIGLSDDSKWNSIVEALNVNYPDLEATSFDILDAIYYKHSVEWLNTQFYVVQIIILAIVLLGIFNTISTSVMERKQEIGNLRANGESIRDIIQLITTEGVLLGFIGSAVGILTSYILLNFFLNNGIEMPPGPGLTKSFYVSFKFEWSMVFFTLSLSLFSSLTASLLAGIKVAKMPIAKALRS